MSPVTLQTIADTLGYSKAMVSRALTGHGAVAPEKRAAILATARKLGYQADSRLGYLSALRWGHRTSGHPLLAYLGDHYTAASIPKQQALKDYAGKLGYRLEKWVLQQGAEKQVGRQLYHRGIQGVLLDLHWGALLPELDWDSVSVVVLGDEHPDLRCHRVTSDWGSGFDLIAADLRASDVQRVGIVVHPFAGPGLTRQLLREALLFREECRHSGAQWCEYLMLPVDDPSFQTNLIDWFKAHQPHAIITCAQSASRVADDWIRAHPGVRHYLLHDREPVELEGRHGLDIQLEHRIRMAVDLLHSELLHNRKGWPEVPLRQLVPARWRSPRQDLSNPVDNPTGKRVF